MRHGGWKMEPPLIDETIRKLTRQYAQHSPEQIALQAGKRPELPLAFVAQQIKGRAKARKKLPSWHAEEAVAFPPSLALEQCSSERAARYKAGLVEPGARGADLTGGFGVDARFLAERFERFDYVEGDAELARVAEWNFGQFGLGDRVRVESRDCIEYLDALEGELDFIYIDPARRDERSLRVSAFEDCRPNLLELWDGLLATAKQVMVKASPGLDVAAGLGVLSQVSAVHVVSVENECKELLFVARRGFEGEPVVHAVNVMAGGAEECLSFRPSEEREAESVVGIPKDFIYEPNASIMKAGGFKVLCARYGMRALNPRTRLFCADRLVPDFPGRVFRIKGVGGINAADAKRLFPGRKANVVARNCGMAAEELRRKLKLKDGGALFAIAAAVSDVGRPLFCCERVDPKTL